MAVLPKRMARFGLRLHPEKTKLLSFRPQPPQAGGEKGVRSFDFLGFTHFWARNRRGY
jgi:RNA-directed DNA polymerase